jgi:hypothetical protein
MGVRYHGYPYLWINLLSLGTGTSNKRTRLVAAPLVKTNFMETTVPLESARDDCVLFIELS